MTEADANKLMSRFQQIRFECDTPEKATALLQNEGLLDEKGEPSEHYREPMEELVCR